METANPWLMRLVHRRKIIPVVGLFLLISTFAGAQQIRWAYRHNPEYDLRKISYGFAIGIHTSAYQIQYSPKFVTPDLDTVHSVNPPFNPGFSLGFLVNLRLHELLDLRLMPKAGFYNHRLIYNYTNRTSKEQFIETTMVEFPVLLKFKSMRRGNVRMYMLGGATPALEASGKREVESVTSNLTIKKGNISLDAGIGFDFYFPLFKFSQEIRFSRGVRNILGTDASAFKEPISRVNTNTISVYFIFQ